MSGRRKVAVTSESTVYPDLALRPDSSATEDSATPCLKARLEVDRKGIVLAGREPLHALPGALY